MFNFLIKNHEAILIIYKIQCYENQTFETVRGLKIVSVLYFRVLFSFILKLNSKKEWLKKKIFACVFNRNQLNRQLCQSRFQKRDGYIIISSDLLCKFAFVLIRDLFNRGPRIKVRIRNLCGQLWRSGRRQETSSESRTQLIGRRNRSYNDFQSRIFATFIFKIFYFD
jgi:hypothetical protein